MTARQTRRAYQLTAGDYIWDEGVLHLIAYTQPVVGSPDVLLVFANSWTTTHHEDAPISLASPEEIADARRAASETGRGVCNFPPGADGPPSKPKPDGWPISDGHRAAVDDAAMRHSRDYNGGTEA